MPILTGYKKIKIHMIYDVKHNGRDQAKLDADVHLTELTAESVSSGAVSFKDLCIFIFIAEYNGFYNYKSQEELMTWVGLLMQPSQRLQER